MAQFEAFEDGVEVNGQTVLAFVDGIPSAFEDRAIEVLADNGIEDPEPGSWYSQQAWLDAFAVIADRVGESTLGRIGRSIPENADWPPGIDSVVGGLESIDEAYHMNHRGGEIGHYDAERVDDDTVHVRCDNPYACAFDTGIVEAVGNKFADAGFVEVREIGDECRAEGGEECVYEVTW